MSSAVRVYKHLSIEHLLPKNYSVTAFVVLFIFYHVNLQVTENNNLYVVSLPVHFFELKQNRVHPSSCILSQQFNSFENLLTVSKYSYHFRFAEQDTLQKQNHFCSRTLLKEFHQLKTRRDFRYNVIMENSSSTLLRVIKHLSSIALSVQVVSNTKPPWSLGVLYLTEKLGFYLDHCV